MKFYLYVLLLLTVPNSVFAQSNSLSGQVVDAHTREPLAFVHVTINDSKQGTTTSINGRFQLSSQQKIEYLNLTYVGYERKKVIVDDFSQNLIILLAPDTKILSEIDFLAGENPALTIMRNAIGQAKANNPQQLDSYYFKSYNKFYIDGFNQDINENPDKILKSENPDSSVIEFYQFLQDKYLFLMESITEKKFRQPDLINEKVLANEISGLQNNTFTTLANSFQPFSFYDKELEILGVNFINPVSNPGLRRYFYELRDSIISETDTVYIISFEPDKGNSDLLTGLLYINTQKWAIQNVIGSYEDPESISFKIQQQYEQVNGAWFPVQLNTDVIFNTIDMGGFLMNGIGRSYLYDIKVDLPLKSSEFTRMALEFDEDAAQKSEDYWQENRKEPMTNRGNRTVSYLDSVSREIKLDKIVKIAEKVISGHAPLGILDFPFNRVLRINQVESVRLGLGIRTNEKLSNHFSLNGYFGYGFRDKGWKYGGGLDLYPLGNQDFKIDFKYTWDLMETGAPQFYSNNFNMFSSDTYRSLIVQLMDRVETFQGGIHFSTMKYFDIYASLSKIEKSPYTNEYRYLHANENASPFDSTGTFNYTIAGLQIKYARTQYYPFLGQKIPVKNNYPVILLNYYRGFSNLLDGQFAFNKIDFQLSKRFRWGLRNSDLTIRAGYIDTPLPYTEQYFTNGSKTNDFTLFIPNSFVTMPLNEFLNDRYATIHLRQELFRIGNDNFYIKLDGHGSAGWGKLSNPEDHSITYRTMEKGYYETGLSVRFPFLLDNTEWIVGSFYRLGEYSFDYWQDNLTFAYSIETRF